MEEEKCPKCGIAAVSVKYRERKRKAPKSRASLNAPSEWLREYRCPVGHKWTRVMVRSRKID
jgi:hypothetical protein